MGDGQIIAVLLIANLAMLACISFWIQAVNRCLSAFVEYLKMENRRG